MVGAQHMALDAELLAQAEIQAVGDDDEAGRNLLAAGKRDDLAVVAVLDLRDPVDDEVDTGGNFAAHRVDEVLVANAPLVAHALFDDAAHAHHPIEAVEGGGAANRVVQPRLLEDAHLAAVDLFAAEFRPVGRSRIDKNGIMAGTAQHGGGDRAGKTGADDHDFCLSHLDVPQNHFLNLWYTCFAMERSRRNRFSASLTTVKARPAPRTALSLRSATDWRSVHVAM